MILNISFKSASGYEYETMRTEFDRNYRDEEQALVFVQSEEDNFNGYYEVNIRKEHGKPTEQGYVAVYQSEDDAEPSELINDVQISVTLHDFDNVLEFANVELLGSGVQIVLEYDGECYWAIGLQNTNTREIDWYAEGNFEHEVTDLMYECWSHAKARVNNPDMVQPTDEQKMWVVSYVGLSDSEYDANGYCECKVCKTKEDAKRTLKEWRENEIECLKSEGREYEILEDEDDECRISWCGRGEQLRLEIHEVAMQTAKPTMRKFEVATEPKELEFYSIELDSNGEKQIHIIGYTEKCEDHWECTDVCWFIEPLAEFIQHVNDNENYVGEQESEYKQYIKDCTAEELTDIVNRYFDGNRADYYLPFGEITIDTPCGNYVC